MRASCQRYETISIFHDLSENSINSVNYLINEAILVRANNTKIKNFGISNVPKLLN